MRKIAVVTGTRAEYGILCPLIEKIKKSSKLELQLIVTGMHLLKKYGQTIDDIKADGFRIDAEVPMYLGDEQEKGYYGKALGRAIEEFTDVLQKIRPDILIVFGDRLEALAATLAASTLRIPIAHIHGGDKTESGHIDESIRHSITKFAHIHFPATKESANRLLRMGEEPWRVHKVGALSLDSILQHRCLSKEELAGKLGLNPNESIIVCIFHPIHLEIENAGEQMRKILEALKEIEIQAVIIYPNNDAGSQYIISEIERYRDLPFVRIFPTLRHADYVSLLNHADVLIGNSSSGIIEAPSIGLPVVNIGSRNVGREHTNNILFTGAIKREIIVVIEKALYDDVFRKQCKECINPYGDGHASDRIIRILTAIEINERLLRKRLIY